MNSSRKGGNQILGMISAADAQRLLLDWVNIDPFKSDDGTKKRLLRRYPEVFYADPAIYDEWFDHPRANTPEHRQRQRFLVQVNSLIRNIALLLQEAWNASDPRRREWYFIKTRLAYQVETERLRIADQGLRVGQTEVSEIKDGVVQPKATIPTSPIQVEPREEMLFGSLMGILALPEVPLTPFEAAMFYLQTQLTDKIRRCPNSTCPAPYFFATKRAQKFCSASCAEPAQREAKRRWWNENRGSGATKGR
jgi:hypothetical protein